LDRAAVTKSSRRNSGWEGANRHEADFKGQRFNLLYVSIVEKKTEGSWDTTSIDKKRRYGGRDVKVPRESRLRVIGKPLARATHEITKSERNDMKNSFWEKLEGIHKITTRYVKFPWNTKIQSSEKQ